jgi:CubicO group peptidase (beta-lactamase class C family)
MDAGARARRRLTPLIALAACAVFLLFAPGATAGTSCPLPGSGGDFQKASPTDLDLDPAAVQEAINFASTRNATSVRIYRHNCLAGSSVLDPLLESTPNNIWSSTKGVVSLLTGRAERLGYLDVNDPIGEYVPSADAAHARITIRDLLTETSGIHFVWTADLHMLQPDSVRYALSLPFDHEPGTYFEYAQMTVNVLAYVVQRAVGEDLQSFAQRELFDPLGIPRNHWFWLRDRAGNTHGWANLFLPPIDMARVGELMLNDGVWRGQRLLSAEYVRDATTPTPTNGSYGYLLWPNGSWAVTPSIPERRVLEHRIFPSAPPDTYAFIGFQDQLIFVIPSLDMVVVRAGTFGNHGIDLQALLTANTGDWTYEFFRILMRGVRDRQIPDPGRFQPDPPAFLDAAYFVDPQTTLGSLGLGPSAPPGCNLLGCDGQIYYQGLVHSGQDALAALLGR